MKINQHQISVRVQDYLKRGGTKDALIFALKIKSVNILDNLIQSQTWTKDDIRKLKHSKLISFMPKKVVRDNLKDADKITEQVIAFIKTKGSQGKVQKLLGMKNNATIRNRLLKNNWTSQELSILINQNIVDDSFTYQ